MASQVAASGEDIDDFVQRASEVSMLIDGLAAGTLTPDYIDSKLARQAQQDERHAQKPAHRDAAHSDEAVDPADDADLQLKVAELKANFERKKAARKRYDAHIRAAKANGSTDYVKWDLWCPEDDEDELLASCTPNNPQLRAMEQDINDRHDRMVRQRQVAERHRVAGNEAFATSQWAEAYRQYEAGLEAERCNVRLQANAGLAALKLGCFAQAIEHCDKVLRLFEFMLQSMGDPLVVKTLMRRASARRRLEHYAQAVQDLEKALEFEPYSQEVQTQLTAARQELAEQRRERKIARALADDAASHTTPEDLPALRRMEAHVRTLRAAVAAHGGSMAATRSESLPGSPQGSSLDGQPERKASQAMSELSLAGGGRLPKDRLRDIARDLTGVLTKSEDLRIYFRTCGGVATTAELLYHTALPLRKKRCSSTVVQALAKTLTAACGSDCNVRALAGTASSRAGAGEGEVGADDASRMSAWGGPGKGQSAASRRMLHAYLRVVLYNSEAAALLFTLSTEPSARRVLAEAMCRHERGGLESPLVAVCEGLSMLDGAHRVHVLQMLSNCATEREFTGVVDDVPGLLEDMAGALSTELETEALRPTAQLLTNLARNKTLRKDLVEDNYTMHTLTHCLGALSFRLAPSVSSARLACLQAVFNLALDGGVPVRTELQRDPWLALLQALLQNDDANEACALAMAAVARIAAADGAYRVYEDRGLVAQLMDTGAGMWLKIRGGVSEVGGSEEEAGVEPREGTEDGAARARWLRVGVDAQMRLLAAWGQAGAFEHLRRDTLLQMLLWGVEDGGGSNGVAGNAALCLGYLANDPQMVPWLRDHRVVHALVQCVIARKGSPAGRNAAIAAARLANDTGCKEQFAACNGLEVIYRYVTP